MTFSTGAFSRPRLLLCLLVAVSLIAAAGSAPRAGAATSASTALSWTQCGRFDCATLSVPLDYDNPDGRHIDIALIRQKARDQANRIGSLFTNPGGPGGSGIEFLQSWAPSLAPAIRDRFDIVSFDPRGVGKSTPLVCHANIQALAGLDPSPDSEAEWQQVDAVTRTFADNCAASAGAYLLPYLGTENVARDLEEMRIAVGDDKLSYFGYSYGTEIGAVYADMFPDHVRAMVLDGAVDIGISGDELAAGQALGFETALQHFVAYCDENKCLDSGSEDTMGAIDALLDRVETNPLPAPVADRPAGPGEVLLGIVVSLYSKRSWPSLSTALQLAVDGDGSALVRLADLYLGRNPDGSYGNEMEVNSAVNCLDDVSSRDPKHYEEQAAAVAKLAPHFGAAIGQGSLVCAYWPTTPQPLSVPHAEGAPPIVVIGTTADPATPYKWAVAMSQELSSGVLVTNHGEGHTAYRSGSACIDDAVNAYLISLEVPKPDTSCGVPIPGSPPPDIEAPLPTLSSADHAGDDVTLLVGALIAGGVVLMALIFLVQRTQPS